jgi:CHASE3 domain sensor protein
MCFGCKKVTKFLPAFHLSDCPEAEKHIATLKEMIAPSDADPIKDLEMLKKRFKVIADELDELQGVVADKDDKNEALVKLIEEMCEGREDADKWLTELRKINDDDE